MSEQPSPKQRRNQRGSVEDRWRKRVKDESGNTVDAPSAVAGKVRRWRARYVDNAGREHSRTFDRKVDAQKWLDAQLASLLRGEHVAPKDAKLTVGEWCDKWLAGYGTRRKSTVRQAEVHIKIIKAHFDAVPLSAVRPSDVRAWTAALKAEGRADSYIYAQGGGFGEPECGRPSCSEPMPDCGSPKPPPCALRTSTSRPAWCRRWCSGWTSR